MSTTATIRRQKFRTYFAQQNDYTIFVGVPLSAPQRWDQVYALDGDHLVGTHLQKYALNDILSWVVAYAGTGEIVDAEKYFEPLPKGVVSIIRQQLPLPAFSQADLHHGNTIVKIQHSKSPTHPNQRAYYSTTLANISKNRFRCHSFGGYRIGWNGFKLRNVTGGLYSAKQFEEWYGVRRGGWIEPGEKVCDPSNYGSNCMWVYHCESGHGDYFHVGALSPTPSLFGKISRFFLSRRLSQTGGPPSQLK